ncbi:MAG: hypothetical protein ACI9JL_002418 [Paracoccaceae bacterium]|jgi:hypothetical protein
MTKTSKIALMAMVLLLTLLSPRLANAFCVYNSKNSDRTVMISQFLNGNTFRTNTGYLEAFGTGFSSWFVTKLAPNGKSCCNWQNKDCNKGGGRNHSLIFGAINQSGTSKSETFKAQMCHGVIPAGGALVVTAKGGKITCRAGSKYGRDLGYYHPTNSLSWKMRHKHYDRMYTPSQRADKVDWPNVFAGGKLPDGSKLGVCRGYRSALNLDWQQKMARGIQGREKPNKNSKGLILGHLENKICIAEMFGQQVRFGTYEYLVAGTRAKWVKSDGGRASSRNAMYAGVDWTSHLLNICRAKYKGGVYPGKQYGDQCYIAAEGKAFGVRAPFEVLVKR